MTWVKICGTTNLEDALTAVDAGADAVGFVFYEKSPRNIDVETARGIVNKLPESVEKVGVFVDLDSDGHPRNRPERRTDGSATAWEEVRWPAFGPTNGQLRNASALSKLIPMIHGDALKDRAALIDDRAAFVTRLLHFCWIPVPTAPPEAPAQRFDWQATRPMVQAISLEVPVIVAGGLTPANVGEAMTVFQPFGVDVVSGVEASPGKKDPHKVRAFVNAVREIDRKTS